MPTRLVARGAAVLAAAGVMMACSSETGDDGGGGQGNSTAPGGSGGSTTSSGTGGSGGTGGTISTGGGGSSGGSGGAGGSACYDPGPLPYENGCLTFAGASTLCGFESDESICEFSVGCGTSSDLGQCKINCEMGVTTICNTETDVQCLLAAACAEDCNALGPCGFIL